MHLFKFNSDKILRTYHLFIIMLIPIHSKHDINFLQKVSMIINLSGHLNTLNHLFVLLCKWEMKIRSLLNVHWEPNSSFTFLKPAVSIFRVEEKSSIPRWRQQISPNVCNYIPDYMASLFKYCISVCTYCQKQKKTTYFIHWTLWTYMSDSDRLPYTFYTSLMRLQRNVTKTCLWASSCQSAYM